MSSRLYTGRLLEEYMSKDEKLKFQAELEEATKKIEIDLMFFEAGIVHCRWG